MNKTKTVTAAVVVLAALSGGFAPAGATETDDSGFAAADAGTFGVVDDDSTHAYCLADAGSFGLSDPIAVCEHLEP